MNRFGGSGQQPRPVQRGSFDRRGWQGPHLRRRHSGIQVFDPGRILTVAKVDGPPFGMAFNHNNELLVAARNKMIKFALTQ